MSIGRKGSRRQVMNAQWQMMRRSSTLPSSHLATSGCGLRRIGGVTPLAMSLDQALKRALGHQFSDVRLYSRLPVLDGSLSHQAMAHSLSGIQRKLEVASSNDPLEREAERAADRVMHMGPTPALTGAP